MKTFYIRTLTSIVLVAVITSAIIFSKLSAFILFGLILSAILYESAQFFPFKSKLNIVIYSIAGFMFYTFAIFGSNSFTNIQWGMLFIMFILSAFIIVSTNNLSINKGIAHIAMFFYATIPAIIFIRLFDLSLSYTGMPYFFPLVIMATLWIGDAMSYIIGMLIGKHIAFSKLSPKKTWEGYIGGFIITIIILIIYGAFSKTTNINILFWIITPIIIFITGSTGDLLESSLKRKAKIKDLSKILPGHGGIFDRFDSFMFAIPFIMLFILTIISI